MTDSDGTNLQSKIDQAKSAMKKFNKHTKHFNLDKNAVAKEACNAGLTGDLLERLLHKMTELSQKSAPAAVRDEPLRIDKYKDAVACYLNQFIIKNKETKKILDTLIDDYKGEKKYTHNMTELYYEYMKDITTIENKIDKYTGEVETDYRKSFYENQKLNLTDKIRHYMKYIYFALPILLILFGGFFKIGMYKDIKVWVFLVIYIILPFIVKYLVAYLYNIYVSIKYYFYPKNTDFGESKKNELLSL